MPWIEPVDQYAKPPRVAELSDSLIGWSGEVEDDGDEGRIDGFSINGGSVDAAAFGRLGLIDTRLSGVKLETTERSSLEISGCVLKDCDLSGARIRSMRAATLIGCKLSGVVFSEGSSSDVGFEDCLFQYTSFHRSQLSRISFRACQLNEADFSGAKLADVTFENSILRSVDFRNASFERVDLREAESLGVAELTGLTGCLISDAQVQELAYALALGGGVSIERR